MTIEEIYKEDQSERISGSWSEESDSRRRKLACSVLCKLPHFIQGYEWFYFGHVYHHGPKIVHNLISLASSVISFCLGFFKARNLFALSIDRLLMKLNLPQFFGTQLYKKNSESPWMLYKSIPFSDRVRKLFLCETRAEVQERINKMNYSKI